MRIYKGSDNQVTLALSRCNCFCGDNASVTIYTKEGGNSYTFSGEDLNLRGNIATIYIEAGLLDCFDDGVLRYVVTDEGNVSVFSSTYYVATPPHYTPIHPEEGVILIGKTITENGEYTPEEGYAYNNVVVDVPTGGDCPELEQEVEELNQTINDLNDTIATKDNEIGALNDTITAKDTTITELNGTIAIRDNEIEVLTQEVNDAFDEGVRNQKSKLTSTTIKTNGTYTREDGWNEVNVNIPMDAKILDMTLNLQQMMANNINYKYSSSFVFGSGAVLNISSSQDVVIIDYEGNCTRYIGQSVTHRCTSYYNMVYVFSNSTAGLSATHTAKYGCVYSDNITRYDRLPRADKLDMYFTPECEIVGAVTGLRTEIKFHTKDKPNINTIYYPNNLFLYFPTGTDLEDLRAQYPNVTIIEY